MSLASRLLLMAACTLDGWTSARASEPSSAHHTPHTTAAIASLRAAIEASRLQLRRRLQLQTRLEVQARVHASQLSPPPPLPPPETITHR